MYNVSTAYKSDIKNVFRNPSYIEVDFSITDADANADSYVTDNGHTVYSVSDGLISDAITEVEERYATFEKNNFVLDGTSKILPASSPYEYQGFVGNTLSGIDTVFSTTPIITIEFLTQYFDLAGLTMKFDTVKGDFPTSLTIIAYNDLTEVYNDTFTPTSSNTFVSSGGIPDCNLIEIIANNSNLPYRRFKVEEVFLGLVKRFTGDDIETCTWKKESDFINSKLPKVTFDFTVLDVDREYDPENPTGIYPYIEKQQPVSFRLGYELDTGVIEYVKCGDYVTSGDITIDSNNSIPRVTFKTISLIGYMTDIYRQGVYSSGGRSLYDLAEDILTYSGLPLDGVNNMWILDSSLSSLYSKAPLPELDCRSLLQLIANAGMCILDVDRNGYITIKPKVNTDVGFTMKLNDDYVIPTFKNYPTLQGVDTYENDIKIATTISELGVYEVSGASSTTYEVSYDSASNISASAGAGLTIVGTPSYFSRMCRIVLTGTGTLTLSGYKLIINKMVVSSEFNLTGERCPVENILLTNKAHTIAFADWIGAVVNRKNEYTIENRGFPELDIGDRMLMDTLYTTDYPVDILSSEITFNGAIKGTTKVLGV